MNNLTDLNEWRSLIDHHNQIANHHMRDWFLQHNNRFTHFSLSSCDILLDYSRNRINEHTIPLLCNLAAAIGLTEKIDALFNGRPINATENRPALHTALRDKQHTPILVNHQNIAQDIALAQAKSADFVNAVHSQSWRGVTGKPILHIVNIGIGGSYTGPMMCIHALKDFAKTALQFHFIASVDKDHLDDVLKQIDPETTLFIISSKSFTTLETLTNAHSVSAWMKNQLGEKVMQHHFIAVTSASAKALEFGIPNENIFPLWDWVGGRYSVWSAIGLPLMLMIGNQQFAEFLAGAYEMDQHFRYADFAQNMPVLLALLGIWYMNFFGTSVHALVPYSHRLRYLVPYLQQTDMESNGKSMSVTGNRLGYTTSPVLFGEEGIIGQHAFHQLLHQGQHLIPVDFILVGNPKLEKTTHAHHNILIASALSQAQALMHGKTYEEARRDLLALHYTQQNADELAHHQIIPGNKPSNILFLERINPRQLGAIIALYEHKVFVQGAIWNINSFDQWGVELGKQLLPAILRHIQNSHDAEINAADLIRHFHHHQN